MRFSLAKGEKPCYNAHGTREEHPVPKYWFSRRKARK